MKKHFLNIEFLYGDASIQMPNGIFRDLSVAIKDVSNIQQISFAYAYLVCIAFLYKYANFIDIGNGTYIQNADIKEILGYNRNTKSIDYIIKKDGMLDRMNLTKVVRDCPIFFFKHPTEKINNVALREYVTTDDIGEDNVYYSMIKKIVKNRNYVIKEPLFLTAQQGEYEYGTLYSYEYTHKISIYEFLAIIFDDNMDNIDFLIYGYLKSKCKGYKDHMKAISLDRIIIELGIDKSTFYKHLHKLENNKYIDVNHKGWRMNIEDMELNEYFWKGVRWNAEK